MSGPSLWVPCLVKLGSSQICSLSAYQDRLLLCGGSLKTSQLPWATLPFGAASPGITSESPEQAKLCLSEVQGLYFAAALPLSLQDLELHYFTVVHPWLPLIITALIIYFSLVNSRAKCSSPLVGSDGQRGGQAPRSDQTTAGQLSWWGIRAESPTRWSGKGGRRWLNISVKEKKAERMKRRGQLYKTYQHSWTKSPRGSLGPSERTVANTKRQACHWSLEFWSFTPLSKSNEERQRYTQLRDRNDF